MEKKEEQKVEIKDRYERATVPDTYKEVISDNQKKLIMDDLMSILTEILNKIEKVERSVA